jgi:hypothetical protein
MLEILTQGARIIKMRAAVRTSVAFVRRLDLARDFK